MNKNILCLFFLLVGTSFAFKAVIKKSALTSICNRNQLKFGNDRSDDGKKKIFQPASSRLTEEVLEGEVVNNREDKTDNDRDPQDMLTLSFSQLRPFLNIAVPFFKEDEKARASLIGMCCDAMSAVNHNIILCAHVVLMFE